MSLDVGSHVANTLEGMFNAVISGTRRSIDFGQALLGTFGNIVTDIFRQIIQKKVSFEFDLFNNLRGLPGQMNSALAAGTAGVGGGGAGGGGGIFGGGGGILSTLSGLILPGLGGSAIGALIGRGGIGSTIGGGIGGIAGSLLSSAAIPSFLGGIGGTFGGTLGAALGGSALGGLGAIAGNFILPGIGAIAGGFLGGLFGGGRSRRDTSPLRRAQSFQRGLSAATSAGFHLLQGEQELLQQAAMTDAGAQAFKAQIEDLSIGAIAVRLATQQAKGSRALGFFQQTSSGQVPVEILLELARRGIDVGVLGGVTAAKPGGIPPPAGLPVSGPGINIFAAGQAEILERMDAFRRTLPDTLKALEDETKELRFQQTVIGKSAEEALRLRREFELIEASAAGASQAQLDQLQAAMELRDVEQLRLQNLQQFESLSASLRREVEERRLDIETFGLPTEQAAALRRDFELGLLREQGLSESQLGVIRELAATRDALVEELRRLQDQLENPAPASVTIQLTSNDPEEIAERLSEILSGRLSP